MMKRIFTSMGIFILATVVSFASPAVAKSGPKLPDMEKLGKYLFKDKNLSYNGTQSCQTCHHPFAGFADRENQINPYVNVVSTGADGVSKGGRNAPSAAYAGFSPKLSNTDGDWVGGLFWDGRADGSVLGDPLAEQAQGPPLNPVEMNMEEKAAVIEVIASSDYAQLFMDVFGPDAFADTDEAYDNFAKAVAAYERSAEVTQFSSKYDIAQNQFTKAEIRGADLFEKKCSSCHSTVSESVLHPPLFTNYQYYNIGVPANPLVPLDNPDFGLGITVDDAAQDGKFKVPTLRNIALSPPYSHNGNFPTLDAMVRFLNDNSDVTPEVGRNIDPTVGNMGLLDSEIEDIIAFLLTLTDGY